METQPSRPADRNRYRAQSFAVETSLETDVPHTLEQELARGLRGACDPISIGGDISQSDGFRGVLSSLEYYLPAMLREVHAYWKHESLDAVLAELAVKTGSRTAEIAGHCILISDQTLTPYHVQLRYATDADKIEWFDFRLGEIRGDNMVRIPYNGGVVPSMSDRLNSIQWKFHVGFGDEDSR